MNTKLDLYAELESAMSRTNISYDRDESQHMIIVQDTFNTYKYAQVHRDYYITGYINYSDDDNSYEFTNVGCPEFDDGCDAADWLVTG